MTTTNPNQLHLIAPLDLECGRRLACLNLQGIVSAYPNADARLMWRESVQRLSERRMVEDAIDRILVDRPDILARLVDEIEADTPYQDFDARR